MPGRLSAVAKKLLKENSAAYRVIAGLKRAVYSRMRALELRTGLREKKWSRQQLDSILGYWEQRNDKRKTNLIHDVFLKHSPTSLLEIGCNCGPNLFILGKMFPDAKLTGIDISPLAVEQGNKWLQEEGVTNARLMCGKAENLLQFDAGSFDIVFSWATLLYPQPSAIKEILGNMLRAARHAMVVIEMQAEKPLQGRDALGIPCIEGEWKRDYVSILGSLVSSSDIHLQWVPREMSSPGGGTGAVVTVVKR